MAIPVPITEGQSPGVRSDLRRHGSKNQFWIQIVQTVLYQARL